MLADWLVTLSPFCSEVVFHPKVDSPVILLLLSLTHRTQLMPWFVSDVQPHDFSTTIASLLDPAFFPESAGSTDAEKSALKNMVERWQRYVDQGVFRLSVPLGLEMGAPGGELADCTPFFACFSVGGILSWSSGT